MKLWTDPPPSPVHALGRVLWKLTVAVMLTLVAIWVVGKIVGIFVHVPDWEVRPLP